MDTVKISTDDVSKLGIDGMGGKPLVSPDDDGENKQEPEKGDIYGAVHMSF